MPTQPRNPQQPEAAKVRLEEMEAIVDAAERACAYWENREAHARRLLMGVTWGCGAVIVGLLVWIMVLYATR